MAEKYTAEMAHAAAARGAAWLDKKCPGWELEINLADLDLGEGDRCILGQTAHCITKGKVQSRTPDSYCDTLERLTRTNRWAQGYGFYVSAPWPDSMSHASYEAEETARYEMLTIAWSTLIRERVAVPE